MKFTLNSKSGFSLIELLAVLSVMVILGGVIGVSLREPSGSQALRSSTTTMMGIFRTARTLALSNNAPVRVIIHADHNEPEKFLRYVGIIQEETIDGETGWVATGKGFFLPNKIYYVPEANVSGLSDGSDGRNKLVVRSKLAESMKLQNFPLTTIMRESGTNWLYYEFTSNGTIKTEQKNATFLLTTGITLYDGDQGDVQFTGGEYTVEGFVIRPTGLTTKFNDIDDIRSF